MTALYNEEVKERFLGQYTNESTRRNYHRILSKAAETEYEYKKDIGEFNIEEVKDVLYNLHPPSTNAAYTYGKILTAYTDWYIEHGYRLNNIYQLKTMPRSFYDQFFDSNVQTYLTEDNLRAIEYELVNPQDAICLRLLFEGANGIGLSELTNLKIFDVDFENEILELNDDNGNKRKIDLDVYTLDLIKMAYDQKIYHRNNGIINPRSRNKNERKLVESNYVIKIVNTNISRTEMKAAKQTIFKRLNIVKKVMFDYLPDLEAIKYVNAKNIQKSGMLYYAKLLVERDGELKRSHLDEVGKRFNTNNITVLSQVVNEKNLRTLYNI